MTPAASVLMPAFDAAATIASALASVRRQSLRSWECIVVDDGSADATAEIVASAARADPRFRLLRRPHGGIVAALQAGLVHCRGSIVARMDADDVMHRHRLTAQLSALVCGPDLAGVGCHVRLFPRRALGAGARAYESWLNSQRCAADVARDLFVECPIAHPTLAIRRDVLAELGYAERGWPEDYDLLLRLHAAGHRLGVVPRRLLGWRDHAARESRRSERCSIASFTRCKAAYLATGFLGAASEYVLWGFGGTGKALSRALRRHGKRPSLIVELHPRRLGERIDGAPVVPPEALRSRAPGALVVSVAGAGPRAEIRSFLEGEGWREGRDFVCAA